MMLETLTVAQSNRGGLTEGSSYITQGSATLEGNLVSYTPYDEGVARWFAQVFLGTIGDYKAQFDPREPIGITNRSTPRENRVSFTRDLHPISYIYHGGSFRESLESDKSLNKPQILPTGVNITVSWEIRDESLRVSLVRKPRFTLEELLEGITEENRHGEVDFGPAVGGEVW